MFLCLFQSFLRICYSMREEEFRKCCTFCRLWELRALVSLLLCGIELIPHCTQKGSNSMITILFVSRVHESPRASQMLPFSTVFTRNYMKFRHGLVFSHHFFHLKMKVTLSQNKNHSLVFQCQAQLQVVFLSWTFSIY